MRLPNAGRAECWPRFPSEAARPLDSRPGHGKGARELRNRLPFARLRTTSDFCVGTEGLPHVFPSALARLSPDCVLSISRSRSNSATAAITPIVIRPAGLQRSTHPKARQWTLTPEAASRSTDARTSELVRLLGFARNGRRSLGINPDRAYPYEHVGPDA